jgi:2,4-dienoyl-CoA reductase-like NADH-dependent reductase (Old Yellow Enzyme family)
LAHERVGCDFSGRARWSDIRTGRANPITNLRPLPRRGLFTRTCEIVALVQKLQRIGRFRTVDEFREYLHGLSPGFPLDEVPLSAAEGSPLAEPLEVAGRRLGNRLAIHPMEGWDGTELGEPTETTFRRWRHFGASGAKLIWGGEAFAVRRQGRANPSQLYCRAENAPSLGALRAALVAAHEEAFGAAESEGLLVGLQLTHSGRFCRPHDKNRLEPRIAYHHAVLDAKFGIDPADDSVVLKDEEIPALIDDYVAAARLAEQAGFDFVDVKSCHGYLMHEFLSAFDRPGPYGGSLENRSRLLRETIAAIRAACPGLTIGVRLSLFDVPPFYPDPNRTGEGNIGAGIPQEYPTPYPGFGCRRDNPLEIDLAEPLELLRMLRDDCQVAMVNLSAGSPYYNPHVQRPALYPPSDGYQPPEDPLAGCIRQIEAVRDAKRSLPALPIVGTAYTYFQDFFPHVAQAVVRAGWVDAVGLGRMALSYWDLPADVLAGRPIAKKRICRTFSDCTTGPRSGLISGCYPLDPHYKEMPEAAQLKQIKAELRKGQGNLRGGSPG